MFACTQVVKIVAHNRVTDWPKLGPSLLIATALVVAIRTAKWAAQRSPDALCADVDHDLDREVDFAVRVTDRVLNALLRRKSSLFPEKLEPICEPDDDDVPK